MSTPPPAPQNVIIAKYCFPMNVSIEPESLTTLRAAKRDNAFCGVMSINKMMTGNQGVMYFAPLMAGGYKRDNERDFRFVNTAFEGAAKIGRFPPPELDSSATPHVQLVDFLCHEGVSLERENTDFVGFTLRASPEYTFKDQSQSQNEHRNEENKNVVPESRRVRFAMFEQLNVAGAPNDFGKSAGGQMSPHWINQIKAILLEALANTPWVEYLQKNEYGR